MTVIVTMTHVRAARLCSAGAKVWLKHHGIDVMEFIRDGVPAERLEATGDLYALAVAAIARKENAA